MIRTHGPGWFRRRAGILPAFVGVGIMILIGLDAWKSRRGHEPGDLLTSGRRERCLECHGDCPDPSPAHPVKTLGCATCHLGDPLAADKNRAHRGMVIRSGDLRFVYQTCGRSRCHPGQTHRVLNSVMATNAGFIGRVLELFKEPAGPFRPGFPGVEDLLLQPELRKFRAIDLYSKLCGSCHLWKQRGEGDDEYSRKGGGCSACHRVERKGHSLITTVVSDDHCIPCHNRSGRIGLSYRGFVEDTQSGTPVNNGLPSPDRLSGDRFFTRSIPDIHHEKGLWCIDCHTAVCVMGDGRRCLSKKDQVDIACHDCHGDGTTGPTMAPLDERAIKLAGYYPTLRFAGFERSAPRTGRGSSLYAIVRQTDGSMVQIGKGDGRIHPLTIVKSDAAHSSPVHRRLTCDACHSSFSPQCYGCHLEYDGGSSQDDHLLGTGTPGEFIESRGFSRFERPILGVDPTSRITVIVPGMHLEFKDKAAPWRDFAATRFAALSPHTTRKEVRPCLSCHFSTRTLGQGEGIVTAEATSLSGGMAPGSIGVERIMQPTASWPVPDGWSAGVKNSGLLPESARPFDAGEIRRIVAASRCIICHDRSDDSLYRDYPSGLRRFLEHTADRCPGSMQR